MAALRALLGLAIGFGVSFGSYYGGLRLQEAEPSTALVVGLIAGIIGAIYTSIAFGSNVYGLGFFSLFGLLLDLTWSLLNTLAGLIVWLPACLIVGANFINNNDTRRSGTFAYDRNPRGGGFAATTIGTVIGGGWDSHEEMHVWQARIFGPLYLPVYIVALLLNMLFRLITGKVADLMMESYYRICFEDWAYWGGTSGSSISWGGWIGGFLLSLLYTGLIVLIPAGFAMDVAVLSIIAIGGLIVYSLIRVIAPHGH